MSLPPLPEALAAKRPEEVLLERVVEEAVQRRVDARVAVAKQVQEGRQDAHARRVLVKQQVHLVERGLISTAFKMSIIRYVILMVGLRLI